MEYKTVLNHRYVLGIFSDKEEVAKCVDRLRELHYTASNISIFVANPEQKESKNPHFLHLNKMTKNPETALTGASLGAFAGVAIGGMIGTGMLPLAESFMVSQPVLTALIGLIAGTLLGAASGYLIGRAIPEDDAKDFEKMLSPAEIMLSIHVSDEEEVEQTMSLLRENGAKRVLLNEENSTFSESTVLESHSNPLTQMKKPGDIYEPNQYRH